MHERIEADAEAVEVVGEALRLVMDEGYAELMGSGMFILYQADDEGKVHSVTLSREDLEALLAA